ncbi:MAG: nitrite reductase, copper-containing [Thermoflexus hugenholtzii]|jgi:nitrite reductase (NO-forming)|uniref:copper-containing nitrite reductase n=1 Tax=Thermoflexus TaxID=1495649 RepID=UPI001C7937A5|nr:MULTISPECIES: copper-containing nitrite reductase [Thermoflexus]QWK11409.1 MAG: nitrite reductase, copper-containing [Thermoflexus hugenholtzii]
MVPARWLLIGALMMALTACTTVAATPAVPTPSPAASSEAHVHPTPTPGGPKVRVVRDPADVPPPIRRTEPTTVEVTLTVKEVVAELTDGVTFPFWTFDGTVPGPMIRVMEGDTVVLRLVNPPENHVSHNIDLHAVTGPGGGATVTTVAPGETKTLVFKALKPGAYIYHCAYPPAPLHIGMGMYGIIVVEPKGGLPPVDREFYVVQGEWYTSLPFGQPGLASFDSAKAQAERPEYFTFNGHVKTLTDLYPLRAQTGERIRIFFGVGGPNVGSNFHIIGEIFDRVYAGSPDTFVANEETVYVPPGSAAVFELTTEVPGRYVLVDHALWRMLRGLSGYLTVEGPERPDLFQGTPSGNSGH